MKCFVIPGSKALEGMTVFCCGPQKLKFSTSILLKVLVVFTVNCVQLSICQIFGKKWAAEESRKAVERLSQIFVCKDEMIHSSIHASPGI